VAIVSEIVPSGTCTDGGILIASHNSADLRRYTRMYISPPELIDFFRSPLPDEQKALIRCRGSSRLDPLQT
jgi:hypothetical protein